jgi:hypothetical protein
MKLSVSLQLLDLRQRVALLGRVISSSQGLYLYTNTEKGTHNTLNIHGLSGKHLLLPWNISLVCMNWGVTIRVCSRKKESEIREWSHRKTFLGFAFGLSCFQDLVGGGGVGYWGKWEWSLIANLCTCRSLEKTADLSFIMSGPWGVSVDSFNWCKWAKAVLRIYTFSLEHLCYVGMYI